MKKISPIFLTGVILLLFISCDSKPKVFLDQTTFNKVRSTCAGRQLSADFVVYYFDGDCSFCIAKVRYIENELKTMGNNETPVFIAKTTNPDLLRYHLDNLKITSCVYIEKNREFEKTLDFGSIVKIKANREKENYDSLVKEN